MLKVCPTCHGIYELKNATCPTCKVALVRREGKEAAAKAGYVRPEPVTITDWVLLIIIACLYVAGKASIWAVLLGYSILSRIQENGVWNKKKS
jgi:hypothetical protein